MSSPAQSDDAPLDIQQAVRGAPTTEGQPSSSGYPWRAYHTFGATEEAPGPSGESESESGPLVTVEAPEVPDADGLTSSEFRLVAAQAQDPHLDPKERAEAALLMPFGTRGKLDTCVVVSCATSELTLCRIYRSLCSRVISSSKCTFCTYNDVSNS